MRTVDPSRRVLGRTEAKGVLAQWTVLNLRLCGALLSAFAEHEYIIVCYAMVYHRTLRFSIASVMSVLQVARGTGTECACAAMSKRHSGTVPALLPCAASVTLATCIPQK